MSSVLFAVHIREVVVSDTKGIATLSVSPLVGVADVLVILVVLPLAPLEVTSVLEVFVEAG